MPTMFRGEDSLASSSVILSSLSKSASRPLHSVLNSSAPVRLPSPPITHRLVMPSFTRLQAPFIRPSLVRKSLLRALPMTVPPSCSIMDTLSMLRGECGLRHPPAPGSPHEQSRLWLLCRDQRGLQPSQLRSCLGHHLQMLARQWNDQHPFWWGP